VIGRWTSVDRYGQYYSPYLGMGNNPISSIDPDGGYSWFGAVWRSAWYGGDPAYKSGEDGGREVWGFNLDGEAHFGEDARSGLFAQGDSWYAQAWDSYWNKAHESAVVFNMHDDPNAEGWNSEPMRGLVQDNITLEVLPTHLIYLPADRIQDFTLQRPFKNRMAWKERMDLTSGCIVIQGR
jgi:hypothetical protein